MIVFCSNKKFTIRKTKKFNLNQSLTNLNPRPINFIVLLKTKMFYQPKILRLS